jgi:putative flippase GtrA
MRPVRTQILWYLVCGGSGVAVDGCLFLVATAAGAGYQLANLLGYAAGTLVSFLLNRTLTFRIYDQVGRRLVLFLLVALTGYSCSAVLLWLLVDGAGLDGVTAKVLTLPVVVLLQFSLNRLISFAEWAPAAAERQLSDRNRRDAVDP